MLEELATFHEVSHDFMVEISGPCSALIFVARAMTAGSMPSFFSRVSAMLTAWVWWGIMPVTNMTSAVLNEALAAGAEFIGELPWSMPGMEPDEDEHPGRATVAVRAAAITMVVRSFDIAMVQSVSKKVTL